MDAATRRQGLAGWGLFYVLSLGLMIALFANRSPATAGWLAGLAMVQLAAGIWLWRRLAAGPLFDFGGWPWALLALAALLGLEQAVVDHVLGPKLPWPQTLAEGLRLIVLIGLVEELWFRGLWFAFFRDRPWLALGLGSLLFGLFHLPHGGFVVALTAGVGLVFAAARARGASILALGTAHGLLDWCNQILFPGLRFRLDAQWLVWLFPAACVAIGLAILHLPAGRGIPSPNGGHP